MRILLINLDSRNVHTSINPFSMDGVKFTSMEQLLFLGSTLQKNGRTANIAIQVHRTKDQNSKWGGGGDSFEL